jgi:hypothetical protein
MLLGHVQLLQFRGRKEKPMLEKFKRMKAQISL